METNRRGFLRGAALSAIGLLASKKAGAQEHEHHMAPQTEVAGEDRILTTAEGFLPIETPDVPKLPWRMDGGVKVCQLVAEVAERDLENIQRTVQAVNESVVGFRQTCDIQQLRGLKRHAGDLHLRFDRLNTRLIEMFQLKEEP